jgi:hypothetical protein
MLFDMLEPYSINFASIDFFQELKYEISRYLLN